MRGLQSSRPIYGVEGAAGALGGPFSPKETKTTREKSLTSPKEPPGKERRQTSCPTPHNPEPKGQGPSVGAMLSSPVGSQLQARPGTGLGSNLCCRF